MLRGSRAVPLSPNTDSLVPAPFMELEFIPLLVAALGLSCRVRAFSSCGRRGFPARLAPHCSGPFIAHGVQVCLGLRASTVAAVGLYSSSSVAVEHGLSCSAAGGTFQSQGSNLCPRIGRPIFIHSTVRKVLGTIFGKDVPSPVNKPRCQK